MADFSVPVMSMTLEQVYQRRAVLQDEYLALPEDGFSRALEISGELGELSEQEDFLTKRSEGFYAETERQDSASRQP